jgi:hypothetical protein
MVASAGGAETHRVAPSELTGREVRAVDAMHDLAEHQGLTDAPADDDGSGACCRIDYR